MFGIIIGTACAVGLFSMARRRMRARCGYGGYGYGGRRGFGRTWLVRSLFERLDTTPGQERVIVQVLDELSQSRKAVREEFGRTRTDLAQAVEGGLIEDTTLDEAFARHDRLAAQLRVSFIEAMKKVMDVLDEAQRKQVARLLQGRGFFGGGSVWA